MIPSRKCQNSSRQKAWLDEDDRKVTMLVQLVLAYDDRPDYRIEWLLMS